MRIGGAAVIALITASCASVDKDLLDAQLPDAPETWTSSDVETIAPTGDWLAAFDDNTLRNLVDEALLRNNDLLAAVSRLNQAQEDARIARANQLPSLDASGDIRRSAIVTDPTAAAQAGSGGDNSLSGLGAGELEDRFGIDIDGDGEPDGLDLFDSNNIDPDTGLPLSGQDGIIDSDLPNRRLYINNFLISADIRWELDIWGRLRDRTRAAYRDAEAAYADLAAAELSLAARVAQSWFTLIEARQQRELAERDIEARESNLRVTERRYDRGVASSLDVRLSRSALGSSQSTLALRQRQELEASRTLEVLLGRYPGAEIEAAAALPNLPPLAGAGAPGDILARRPDLIAAEARMEASGLRARAARKELLPTLTLSSRLNTSGPDLGDLIDPERLAGNIAAGIAQPLFQGGRVRANSRRAKAVAEASVYDYVQTVLTAYEEAENALAAENLLAEQERALRFAFEEASAAETLTERRYTSGAATIFELLDAQTRRISAESQFIQLQRERVSNRVQLYLAIGGDFLTEAKLLALATHIEE